MVGSACLAAFGYIVNDYFDRVADRLVGKSNFFNNSPIRSAVISIAVIITGFSTWSMLPLKPLTVGLLFLELVLLFIYSAPLFRLKNRIAGVFVDAAYSRLIPVLTVLSFSEIQPQSTILFVSIWMLLAGTRNILLHQVSDLGNDQLAKEHTTVMRIGIRKTENIILRLLIPLEISVSVVSLFLLSQEHLTVSLLLPFFIGLMLIRFKIWRSEYQSRKIWKERMLFLPNNFYEDVMPIGLLMIFSLKNPSFWFLVLAHSLIFPNSTRKTIADIRLIMIAVAIRSRVIFVPLYYSLKKATSIAVNRPIIWIFLLAGVSLEEEKLSAWGYIKKHLTRK